MKVLDMEAIDKEKKTVPLRKVIKINDLPEQIERINLKKYIRISKRKQNKVRELFRLCYYNSIMDFPEISMAKRFKVYGKLFFNHYELKQRISDEFEKNSKSINDLLKKNLLENIEHNLQEISSDLKQKKPITPNLKSIEEADEFIVKRNISEYDLKKNDPNPKRYSTLLLSLISRQGETKKSDFFNVHKHFMDYNPNLLGFVSHFEKYLLQGYLLKLLSEIIDDFNKKMQKNGEYQARIPASSKAEACIDFLSRGLHPEITSDQAAYLVTLQYKYKKGNKEYKWKESDKESLSSTIRAQKKVK